MPTTTRIIVTTTTTTTATPPEVAANSNNNNNTSNRISNNDRNTTTSNSNNNNNNKCVTNRSEGLVEFLEAVDAVTEVAVVVREEAKELLEALLLLQHVHGQHQAVSIISTTSHLRVVQDGVQVFQKEVQLEMNF